MTGVLHIFIFVKILFPLFNVECNWMLRRGDNFDLNSVRWRLWSSRLGAYVSEITLNSTLAKLWRPAYRRWKMWIIYLFIIISIPVFSIPLGDFHFGRAHHRVGRGGRFDRRQFPRRSRLLFLLGRRRRGSLRPPRARLPGGPLRGRPTDGLLGDDDHGSPASTGEWGGATHEAWWLVLADVRRKSNVVHGNSRTGCSRRRLTARIGAVRCAHKRLETADFYFK